MGCVQLPDSQETASQQHGGSEQLHRAAMVAHRSALKAHVCLLSWLLTQGQQVCPGAAAASMSTCTPPCWQGDEAPPQVHQSTLDEHEHAVMHGCAVLVLVTSSQDSCWSEKPVC